MKKRIILLILICFALIPCHLFSEMSSGNYRISISDQNAGGGEMESANYKAVNTLDSMVGYKDAKYIDIGCFSAKTDDVLNWVPARITGFIQPYKTPDSCLEMQRLSRRDGV